MTLNWAIHRLNGISTPANPAYSVSELRHQLISSGSKALFTVLPLLPTALEAAKGAGILSDRVYICEMPNDGSLPAKFKSLAQLIKFGERLPNLDLIQWTRGQGARQPAFICYSSGTSGLPVRFHPANFCSGQLTFHPERRYDLPSKYDCQYTTAHVL
jgi:acyl-CoA synthetase (AMP-forming)/AMP-acid ligase II